MNNKLQQERKERFIRNLIKEAIINVLAEQEELSSVPPATTPPSPQTNIAEPAAPSPTPATNEEIPETPPGEVEFTVDSMVDQLNVLRGGKSFKDPEVYGKLNTFFNNLTEEQKVSTKWMLEELTKIVTNVETPMPTDKPTTQGNPPVSPPPPATPAPAPEKPVAPPAPIKPSL